MASNWACGPPRVDVDWCPQWYIGCGRDRLNNRVCQIGCDSLLDGAILFERPLPADFPLWASRLLGLRIDGKPA